jgi:diguanylate cyclase (GGDEF)-like protein/PAS domain S-box-containing protein
LVDDDGRRQALESRRRRRAAVDCGCNPMLRGRRAAEWARLPIWAGGFVVLVCVSILTLGAWREWASREAALNEAEIETANLARSLTQHAEDSVELADATVAALVDRLERQGLDPAAMSGVQRFLYERRPTLGRIRGLFIYGEDGRWLATTEDVDLRAYNNGDRDYFRHHQLSPDRGAYIGPPVRSRSSGEWIITVSRRFNHPDGSFAGVVAATINISYFALYYWQFNIGSHGSISLLTADGLMIARSPDFEAFVGRDLSKGALFKNRLTMPLSGSYYFNSPLDGRSLVGFYKRSEKYPFVLVVAESKDELLTPWLRAALARMSVVAALTLLVGLAGFFLIRQLIERQRIQAALQATEADFRLLAEASSDMVTRIDLNDQILYASPSSSQVLGWTPDELAGTSALIGVNADDRPRVDQAVLALKSGEMDETRISYRTRHRYKSEIWIETALRVTRDPLTGLVTGAVAVSRDMTEHKRAEDQLAALAASDALTGLANRRGFDERLAAEWARGARDGTPLSLLLLDIDRFKLFNDRYGHQAGDACLRQVAQVVAQALSRPADLAARYGGEEFAVLLPNTDTAGCRYIGERLRRAVEDLNLSHSENSPWRVATLSVGGATIFPRPGRDESDRLVESADRALYAAKHAGRNRFVPPEEAVDLSRSAA